MKKKLAWVVFCLIALAVFGFANGAYAWNASLHAEGHDMGTNNPKDYYALI